MEPTGGEFLENNSYILNVTVNGTTGGKEMTMLMRHLSKASDVIMPTALFIIMIAMGCKITIAEIKEHVTKPYGILIGLTSQFVAVPALTYGMIRALKLAPNVAIGTLILACAPGGGLSNIWTFWSDGDLSLSVTMTTVSTLLALGMMPLNIFLYGRSLGSKTVVIPYTKIIISMLSLIVPIGIGLIIEWKLPKIAKIMIKVGGVIGVFAVVASAAIVGVLNPQAWTHGEWTLWFVGATVTVLGFSAGLLLSSLARLTWSRRRTVAIETGCQNVPLTLTLISLSFPKDVASEATVVPLIFVMISACEYGLFCILYQLLTNHVCGKGAPSLQPEVRDASWDESQISLKSLGPEMRDASWDETQIPLSSDQSEESDETLLIPSVKPEVSDDPWVKMTSSETVTLNQRESRYKETFPLYSL